MQEQLVDSNFLDYIMILVENNLKYLETTGEFKQLLKNFSTINNKLDKMLDNDTKKLLNTTISCLENMEVYTNALSYLLGIKQGQKIQRLELQED